MTDSKNSVKLISEYTPDEIRRYALRWFDKNSDKNPTFPFISNMLMRIGAAREMRIDAPAAVTITKHNEKKGRVSLHVSPKRLGEISPESGIEIAPWVLGHEMAHVVHHHLHTGLEDLDGFVSSDIRNNKILTTAQECVCNDMFESCGLEHPVINGENPLVMGVKTPGLMQNSYPMDTYDVYSIIANEYEDWKEQQEQNQDYNSDSNDTNSEPNEYGSGSSSSESNESGSGSSSSSSESSDNSDSSDSSDSNSESNESGSDSESNSDKSDSSESNDSSESDDGNSGNNSGNGSSGAMGDMSIYDESDDQEGEDGDGNCSGGKYYVVDENGNIIDSDDISDEIHQQISDGLLGSKAFEEIEEILKKENEKMEEDISDSQDEEIKLPESGSQSSSNYQIDYNNEKDYVIKVPIDREILDSYNWGEMLSNINPIFAQMNSDFSRSFTIRNDWSKKSRRFSSITRAGGANMPDKKFPTGDMVYSMDIDIYLDISGSMGMKDVTTAAMCYYMISQIVGDQKANFYTFSSDAEKAEIEIENDMITITSKIQSWGTSFHAIHDCVLKNSQSGEKINPLKKIVVISDMYASVDKRMAEDNRGIYKYIVISNGNYEYNKYNHENFSREYGEENIIEIYDYER